MFSVFLNNVWNDVMIWAVKIPKLCHVFLSNWWACDFKSLLIKNILALTLSWFEMVDHWNLMLCTWCKQIYRLNNITANNKKGKSIPDINPVLSIKKRRSSLEKRYSTSSKDGLAKAINRSRSNQNILSNNQHCPHLTNIMIFE